MKQKDYQTICKKLALICKLMANSEEHKSHKKKLLKYSDEFEGLGKKIKLRGRKV